MGLALAGRAATSLETGVGAMKENVTFRLELARGFLQEAQ